VEEWGGRIRTGRGKETEHEGGKGGYSGFKEWKEDS